MTTPKIPKAHSVSPTRGARPAIQPTAESNPRSKSQPLPIDNDAELQPALLRYATTVQGLLAERDPHRIRRFILDASDSIEQSRRLIDLFTQSATRLTLDSSRQRVVQTGLYAWPVALCMAEHLRVRSYFGLDSRHSSGLKTELSLAWARALGVTASDVVVHGFIDVRHLAGAAPLAVQSFMGKQCHRASHIPALPAGAKPVLTTPHSERDAWGALLHPECEELTAVGRSHPVAFLLMAFVSWHPHTAAPVCNDSRGSSALRLQSLLQAMFTHESHCPDGSAKPGASHLIQPEVRSGTPQRLHEAMTQAQWMQLAWMAERARRTDCSFELEQRQSGSLLTWSAKLTDAFDQVSAGLEYTYDGFWRPASHVQAIAEQVSLAQATGQMHCDNPLQTFVH